MRRVTQDMEHKAFARLARAMGWDVSRKPYDNGKPVMGAIYYANSRRGGAIEQITTPGGGVHCLLDSHTWASRRESYDTMMAMALAVETFKASGPYAELLADVDEWFEGDEQERTADQMLDLVRSILTPV